MASAWGGSWGKSWGNAWGSIAPQEASGGAGGGNKRYYVRKRKKLYLFNSAQEADAWIEAYDLAQEAIEKAQTKAKRRRIAKAVQKVVKPLEVVDIEELPILATRYQFNINLNRLIELEKFDELMRIRSLILQMQDEEDIELVLIF